MAQIKYKDEKAINKSVCDDLKTFLLAVFLFLRYYFDLLIDKVFGFFYNNLKVPLRSPKNSIVNQSAVALARKIRNKELKSEEVVQAFIDRINEVNPIINSLVDNRFEEALEEARKIDKGIAEGTIKEADFQAKPFLGVPFTTKESSAVKGQSFTFGLVKRKGYKAECDADYITLIKNAGAICLGVTNIPQLNLWQETSNPIYGITKNPYDITRNVGGSSGGTDIGGSCRIPAFMCGVFGHKPTSHLIPTKGMTFRTGKEQQTMVVVGVLSRFSEEITPILKVLVGENVEKLQLDKPVNIKSLKFYYITDPKDPFVSPSREEMKITLTGAVNYFNGLCDTPPKEAQPLIEIFKYLTGRGDFCGSTIFNFINGLLPTPKDDWARATTEQLSKQLLDTLGEDGVLLYPSAPWPASYHHTAFLRPWNFNLFSIWNVLKFPVTQVPMGLRYGLPVGIQVVAAPNQDRLCIAVAKELEKGFGGFKRKTMDQSVWVDLKTCLFGMLLFIRYYFDLLIDSAFGFFNTTLKVPIRCPRNQIVNQSATTLAYKIRTKELSSEQVVQAFIDRINEVNPIINALVDGRFEEAVEEARKIDKEIADGTIKEDDFRAKPFLGVPFTTKETTAVKGLSFTFGLIKRKDIKADFDADCVTIMKNAGAICIGVTNNPEMLLWSETYNPVYGITKNPYDTTRTAGGSTGGDASLLAAGGTGTDIGGSCRIPALMCGVFGHKPTSHLISNKGITFRTGKEEQTMMVVGILSRFAEDIAPILRVLVAENADKLQLDKPVNVKSLKFYYIADPKDPFISPSREEMKSTLTGAVNYFNGLCDSPPKEVEFEGTRYSTSLWKYWMTQESNDNFNRDIMNREGEAQPVTETLKYLIGRSEFCGSTILNFINGLLPTAEGDWARATTEQLSKQLLVPMGLRYGLPVGIQVVAAPNQDRLCIAVAKELEKAFGGFVPPYAID
nr:unnamed protein product [Callosobruchus chinensis]